MNSVLAGVIVTGVLALVIAIAVVASRGGFRGELRGPGGTGAAVAGERSRGVRLRRVRSGRDLTARGAAVDARNVDAGHDARLRRRRRGPKSLTGANAPGASAGFSRLQVGGDLNVNQAFSTRPAAPPAEFPVFSVPLADRGERFWGREEWWPTSSPTSTVTPRR